MADQKNFEEALLTNPINNPLQNNLLKLLSKSGASTRNELVNTLKVPRTTIYDNLLKLQKKKAIEKFTRNNGKRGRPLVFWKISE